MKKINLSIGNKKFIDLISERNLKFECEECKKEIYGKKCKYDEGNYRVICLKCFVNLYEKV